MPRQLVQQWMTQGDRDWPFHASRAISAVAEFLVLSGYSQKRQSTMTQTDRQTASLEQQLKSAAVH